MDSRTLNANRPWPLGGSGELFAQKALPSEQRVDISIYNIRGEKVTTLVSRMYGPGHHEVVWNAKGVASGANFYRVQTDKQAFTKRMMLVK